MGSKSHHIMQLGINNLGADTHTHTNIHTETILRNQARTSHMPAHSRFNNLCRPGHVHVPVTVLLP